MSDILKVKNKKNVLMLRYEDFFDNFTDIYDSVSQFFDIEISHKTREDIAARYQIKNIEKTVLPKKPFLEYDKITHWHGNHISRHKGKSYYCQDFFETDQIEYLENIYSKYLSELDY